MKNLLFSFLLCLFVNSSFAEKETPSTNSSNTYSEVTFPSAIAKLIDSRQYANAWTLIKTELADSTAENTILKSQFCLMYFSHTLYHQKFHFDNLSDDRSLLDYRILTPSPDAVFVNFNPEKELGNIRLKYPENRNINMALGNYYYDVYITYSSQWIKDKKEVMALFYYHFNEAYQAGIKTTTSVYAISLFYQNQRSFAKAEQFLLESLKIDSSYAPAHYNLAYSNSIKDSTEVAVFHAQKAYEYYDTKPLKADAASMVGILYGDLKKHEDAVNWLLISDALAPGNFYVYESLLSAYLHLNKTAEAELITKNLYYYDWRSPKVFNSMLESYLAVNKGIELKAFLTEQLSNESFDEEYRGFVNVHLCQLALRLEDKIAAQTYVDNAKKSFSTAYDKDHGVFKVLESLEYNIKN